MSRPITVANLPPRPPEAVGTAGRDDALIFALKAQGNLFETIRQLERRVEELENRLSRVFVSGG